MDKTTMEILAPAGGEEQLIAAVRSGADAVYLGLDRLNARRNASNFDGEALKAAVSYCHARNTAVHVTLNTLVTDEELPEVLLCLQQICDAGADAVIVQDPAVAALVKERCPELALHASTQMAFHNLASVQAAEELGAERVVLARELSLTEIKEICTATTLEVETFIHGALCMCVSGCCLLSSALGGRSGNRGLCAQPCRLNFNARGREYALSLKDLCGIPELQELQEAGVVSVKIEGRMKRPEYVAAATAACRDQRAGQQPDLKTLKAVFSRSGFTEGYLTGKRNLDMFGSRTKEDVEAAAPVLKELARTYDREAPRVRADMELLLHGGGAVLTVTDGERSCSAQADCEVRSAAPEEAAEKARRSLEKTGGTPFFLGELKLSGMAGTLPASVLNGLRREALEQLLSERSLVPPKTYIDRPLPAQEPHRTPAERGLRLRFERRDQIIGTDGADYVILPLSEIDADLIGEYGDRLMGELPRVAFGAAERKLTADLQRLKEQGLSRVYTEHLYGLPLARRFGLRVHGGFGMNVLNSLTLSRLRELGFEDTLLSCELPGPKMRDLGDTLPRGLVAYGHLPLMTVRACPMQQKDGCGSCKGRGTIRGRKGEDLQYICHGRQYGTVHNGVPLYLGDVPRPADYDLLYFTLEDRERCGEVIDSFLEGKKLSGLTTKGLFNKQLP